MGDEEVYGDMLRECFDVKVSPVKAPHKLYTLKQQPLKKKGYSWIEEFSLVLEIDIYNTRYKT